MNSRKDYHKFIIIYILFLGAILSSCNSPGFKASPNFIVILTDDQQYNAVGINGNNVIKTPLLDRLAEQSVRFTNANVVFSLCSPSRAAILTGRYGSANGVLELNSNLNPGELTIVQYLKKAGYRTGISGKWHLPTPPDSLGFDFYNYFYANGKYYGRKINDMGKTVHPDIHCDEYCAHRAIDFIKEQDKNEVPFFLFYCSQAPHMDHNLTWPAKESTKNLYTVDEMPVPKNHRDDLGDKPEYLKNVRNRIQALKYGYPDSLAIQKHARDYYAVISELEEFVGQILNLIDQLKIADQTYIIFLSDNGWMLGDHGFTSKVLPYKPSSSIPFLIKGPGISATTNNALVANIDVAPTILDLANLEIPTNMHGKSLKPLLQHENYHLRDMLVYEGLGEYGGAKPNLTILTNKYRYIITYEDRSLGKVLFEELYNQHEDYWEIENLVQDPVYFSELESMKAFLEQHRKEVAK